MSNARRRRLSLDGFLDVDGVVREDQLSIAAPVRSGVAHSSDNDPVGFLYQAVEIQALDGRCVSER